MKRTILMYGLAMAILVFLLEYFEYRYLVRELSVEILILIIALVFTALGLWAGSKLVSQKAPQTEFNRNEKAMAYLQISERELEVLEQVAKGLSNKEIAATLFVSVNTVKTHLKKLYEKLEVNRRTQAVEKARELKLIRWFDDKSKSVIR
ncbi:MAG: response regulator transcription factor [Balneolaceae bacterium]|nr:response regulator transcription factor [Balneolaceae bacterium]